jgi:hypothetical protein
MQLQKNNEIPDVPKVYTAGCQPPLDFALQLSGNHKRYKGFMTRTAEGKYRWVFRLGALLRARQGA